MKTVNLLLGSGIHGGELPNVSELTKLIIDYQISDYPPELAEIDIRIKKFINLIFCKILKYYNGYKISSTYEDLIYIIDQLIDDACGNKYNPAIEDFRMNVFREYGFEENELKSLSGYRKLLNNETGLYGVREKVVNVLQNKLKSKSVSLKLNLIEQIILDETVDNINIFTLNHDKEFETFFESKSIKYSDGFNEPCMNNGYNKGFKFDIKLLNSECNKQIKLCKLHGSIDWYYYENINDGYIYRIEDQSIPNPNRYSKMIIGTYNKLELYQVEPFYELFEFFKDQLKYTDKLIISGYGFQDRWINLFTERWVEASKKNKMILIHPYFNRLTNDDRKETFIRNNFKRLCYQKIIIPIEKKFENVKWEEIKSYL